MYIVFPETHLVIVTQSDVTNCEREYFETFQRLENGSVSKRMEKCKQKFNHITCFTDYSIIQFQRH